MSYLSIDKATFSGWAFLGGLGCKFRVSNLQPAKDSFFLESLFKVFHLEDWFFISFKFNDISSLIISIKSYVGIILITITDVVPGFLSS